MTQLLLQKISDDLNRRWALEKGKKWEQFFVDGSLGPVHWEWFTGDSYSRVALQRTRLQRIHRYNVLFPRSRFHVMENSRFGYNVLSFQRTFFRPPREYVITRLNCTYIRTLPLKLHFIFFNNLV